jgi:hypothetical protein
VIGSGRPAQAGEVVVDPAGQVGQPSVAVHAVHGVGDPFQQVAVVAGHHQRAGPGVEQVLGGRERVGVQVVGGLVEQQHIRPAGQQPQQLEAPPLAAGQVGHRCPQPVAAEAELLRQLRRGQLTLPQHHPPGDLFHRLQHPRAAGQPRELLGQVCGADRGPGPHPALVRRQLAGEQPQQGGLAHPVDAHQPDPVPGTDLPGDVVEHHDRPGPQGHRLQLVHLLAEPGGGQPPQRHTVARRRHVGDQRVGRLDAELRLRGARRRPAPQPGDLLAQQVLPAGLNGGRLPGPLRAGQRPGGEPALPGADRAVGHLPGAGADRVQEPTVVRDHHQRAVPVEQVPGQPVHPRHVKMVGRLVEHQHVSGSDQQGGQRHPAALAAGHRPDRGGQAEPWHAQAGEDTPYRGVARPLVLGGETGVQPGRPQHHVRDRGGGPQVELLRQGGHPYVAAVGHPAGVRRLLAGEQPQQRGLAGTVEPHHADPVGVRQAERHVLEQHPGGVIALEDPVEVDEVRHPAFPLVPRRSWDDPMATRRSTRPQQLLASPLAAGQVGHRCPRPVAAEAELSTSCAAVARVNRSHSPASVRNSRTTCPARRSLWFRFGRRRSAVRVGHEHASALPVHRKPSEA